MLWRSWAESKEPVNSWNARYLASWPAVARADARIVTNRRPARRPPQALTLVSLVHADLHPTRFRMDISGELHPYVGFEGFPAVKPRHAVVTHPILIAVDAAAQSDVQALLRLLRENASFDRHGRCDRRIGREEKNVVAVGRHGVAELHHGKIAHCLRRRRLYRGAAGQEKRCGECQGSTGLGHGLSYGTEKRKSFGHASRHGFQASFPLGRADANPLARFLASKPSIRCRFAMYWRRAASPLLVSE